MKKMKKTLIYMLLLFTSFGLYSQGVYNNGARIVIGSGIYFNIIGTNGNLLNETNVTDGSIDLAGTLKLEGNYTNNVSASDILSTVANGSDVAFTGTTNQSIGGSTSASFTFDKLTINNSNGVTLNKDVVVNNTIDFTSGLTRVGTNNLIFGENASVAGTPSSTAMIEATGTGQVRKLFNSIGSFMFPVGDSNVTAKYSPVTINFTSATFAPGAYAAVNLSNSAYSDPLIAGSYLNRYWNLSQSGISTFSCDAVFQYLPEDVTGQENTINSVMIAPTPAVFYDPDNVVLHQLIINGLSSFGTFTGTKLNEFLNLTVFLEGSFNSVSNTMNTDLNTNNLIPLTQPFNTAPWNYAGLENVASIPSGVVDWVLIELRDAATPAAALPATDLTGWPKACFLKSDGSIVDLDGTSLPSIGNQTITNSLFAVVRHRNHVAIMSNVGLINVAGTYAYNFSTAITQAYGGNAGYKQINTGVFGMVGGDVDADGSLLSTDYNIWASNYGLPGIYLNSDLDMDGNVLLSDYNKWAANFGISNIISKGLNGFKYSSQVPK